MKHIPLTLAAGAAVMAMAAGTAQAGDWTGPYVGAYYGIDAGGKIGSDLGGLQFGYNWDTGRIVYGGEIDLGLATDGSGHLYDLSGRVGVDAADNVMLFGLLGFGSSDASNTYGKAGIGAEFGLTDMLSGRVEADYLMPTSGGNDNATELKLGVVARF